MSGIGQYFFINSVFVSLGKQRIQYIHAVSQAYALVQPSTPAAFNSF